MATLTDQQATDLLAYIADIANQIKDAKAEASMYRGFWLDEKQKADKKEDVKDEL